jgi:hypothetical protein
MDVNQIRIVALGNMKGNGDLMFKPASKNEPAKIFYRKGSTTIFHKLADMARGIKQAPIEVRYALSLTAQKNNVEVKNIKAMFKGIQTHIETPYTPGSIELKKPIIFVSNGLGENEIEYIKNNNSFIGKNDVPQNSSAANNYSGPPASADDVGPLPPSYKPNPPNFELNQKKFSSSEIKDLKNKFIAEIINLLPKDDLKIGKDQKNYSDLTEKLDHLEIEIESFSSLVVNQGIEQGIKNKNAQTISDINKQKQELESELIKALDLTGKDNKVIEGLMKDFSKQLEDLTNQYLENGKV